jgi:hypothetical protein
MTSSRNLAEELDRCLEELKNEDLEELPREHILKLKKDVNPLGRTIQGADAYMNFSIINIQLEYYKKFITTAMVGFLNRMNDEWKVPEGVPVIPVYDYLSDKSLLDTPKHTLESADSNAKSDYEFNRKWMEKRIIVKEFLEEMFQFNPDEHVRSAFRPNHADKTRKPIETPAAKLAVKHLLKTSKEFKAKEELYAEPTEEQRTTRTILKKIKGKNNKVKEIVKTVKDVPNNNVKQPTPIEKESFTDLTLPETVRNMIPPHDTFGRFTMYHKENLETLREAVADLYCDKPDKELAINPYSWHTTLEEAELFKKKHSGEVLAEVFTAHSGKWNLFDSFKIVRDSVNFYNDQTIILEEMVKQHERDERLGQDLMKKRVEKAKKKNDIISGPDAESFKKWRSQNTELTSMGALNTNDMASTDCPPDAIEVPVWRIAKGGLEITKDRFFSQAEAPGFVQEARDKARAGMSDAPLK